LAPPAHKQLTSTSMTTRIKRFIAPPPFEVSRKTA
jgi:hypothetical protein